MSLTDAIVAKARNLRDSYDIVFNTLLEISLVKNDKERSNLYHEYRTNVINTNTHFLDAFNRLRVNMNDRHKRACNNDLAFIYKRIFKYGLVH